MRLKDPAVLLEAFVTANFAFLAVDIYIAHSINSFRHWAEWIPFGFSILATLILVPGTLRAIVGSAEWAPTRIGGIVGWVGIAVGVLGMLLHLDSHFFQNQTIRNLVYMAPFAAPLSYAGLGLLILLNRMEKHLSLAWGQWVVFLALAGFVGNFVLALLDHAQNGFFEFAEWIPVVASAYAIGALLVAVVSPANRRFLRICIGVLATQVVVGVLGFSLHLRANLTGPGGLWENFLYGAPIFTPFLFPNLAFLAMIGLSVMLRQSSSATPGAVLETG